MVNSETKISCKGVWKFFGPNPVRFFKRHDGAPHLQSLSDDRYILAMRNITLDVQFRKILMVMGFPDIWFGRVPKWLMALQRCFELSSRIKI